jgi:hypothetical protein
MGESDQRLREKGMRREMKARKQLEELTPTELAEVSGGGMPFYGYRPVYGYQPFYGYRPFNVYRPFYGFRHQNRCFPYI